MISGFSAMAEAMVNPDLERNGNEILPHSTPFLIDPSESLDIPSAMDRGTGIQMKFLCFVIFDYWNTWFKLVTLEHVQASFLTSILVCLLSVVHHFPILFFLSKFEKKTSNIKVEIF